MKKLLAIILSAVMLLSCVACSAKEPEGWYTDGDITISNRQVNKILNSEFETPKNVIVIIGDGMGPNDITLAEENVTGVYDFGLILNKIENHGLVTTNSANAEITDSAAAATALSTGTKTNNGTIGKDANGNDLKTMAETAKEAGKKVGIVTDDVLSGATPSAFTVHNVSRDNKSEIISDIIKLKLDVIMGEDYNSVFGPVDEDARKMLNDEYVVAKDFRRFTETLDTDPECKKPFLGFLNRYSSVASNNLAQGVEVALKRLKNENGFFLMVESCGTDKFGQNNNINGKLNSVVTLDRAVAVALKFMANNPDTLLVITSDHDTGGLKLPEGDEKLTDLLTTNEHTATPVRIFAVGKGAEYFKGKTVDNTDVAKFVINAIKGE